MLRSEALNRANVKAAGEVGMIPYGWNQFMMLHSSAAVVAALNRTGASCFFRYVLENPCEVY
jgi:hypothetical protein